MNTDFDYKIEIIRNLSDHLVPYNFPLSPMEYERDISCLKKMECEVDGYSIKFHFNRADYKDYYLETFQLFNLNSPFLPFNLVVKLAQKVLGGHNLSLIEFYQNEYKIYCWSVCVDKTGRPIVSPLQQQANLLSYQGFEYFYMNPNNLNLY